MILKEKKKILILYVFHIYNDRVKDFFKNVIFKSDDIKFMIVCNNLSFSSKEIPANAMFIKRENKGYDFGAWSYGLLKDDIYKQFDHFIFINSSVIGPFLSLQNTLKYSWPYLYIDLLKNNIKLAGSTINTKTFPHVQSYFFVMNKDTLEFLIEKKIFDLHTFTKTFIQTIKEKEILMSKLIIENGWNIGSFMKDYKDTDFTKTKFDPNVCTDIMLQNIYNKNKWNQYDFIFIKGNRIRVRKYEKINILTRTGNRHNYFKNLKESILKQNYPNIRHIKSNDNTKCTYLDDETDVISVEKGKKNTFYNLYLNTLLENVNEGWVIILDDDCKLTNEKSIENIAEVCKNSKPNEVIIYKNKIHQDGKILPFDKHMLDKKFVVGYIDMCCFCFHHTVFKDIKFTDKRMGDYFFLDQIKKSNKFNFKYSNIPVGIWANYNGAKSGKN